jgi:PST family polysaccharide transporter
MLAPGDFGLYAIVSAVASGLMIFMDLGLCDAVIQAPRLAHIQVSTLFWLNIGIGIAVAVGLALVSPLLGVFFAEPRLAPIVIVWSLTIVFGALSAQHLALLKRAMLFAGVSKLAMLASVISSALAVGLAWFGATYWALVLRDVLNMALTTAGAWLLCRWRPGRPVRNSGIGPMLAFGGHSIGAFIVRRTARNLDRTLLGWRFGPVVAGYYHNAFELAAMFTGLVTEPLRNVAVSSLSRLRDEPGSFRHQYLRALRGVAFLGAAATGVLVACSDDLVMLLLGPQWERSGRILAILGLGAGVSAMYMTNIWLHFSLGRADRMSRWTAVETAAIAAGVTIGLRVGGADGVAWGYTISMFVLCLTGLAYAGHPIGLSFGFTARAVWHQGVAALVAGTGCWGIVYALGMVQTPVMRILSFCSSFVPAYVCLVMLLGGPDSAATDAIGLLMKRLPGRRHWTR